MVVKPYTIYLSCTESISLHQGQVVATLHLPNPDHHQMVILASEQQMGLIDNFIPYGQISHKASLTETWSLKDCSSHFEVKVDGFTAECLCQFVVSSIPALHLSHHLILHGALVAGLD